MNNTDYFKNKKITVVGLARSGLACANLLYDLGIDVHVTDYQDNASTKKNFLELKLQKTNVELGRHTPEFIRDKDLIIISPGVPKDALPIIWAKQFDIPIISEIELASFLCPATIIAVTGSSGKTTVTTLIGRVLEASERNVFVCGNIGTPFSAEVKKTGPEDFVCLEVSSFQLEWIRDFKPKISVILNFSRNHLDRHKDMQEYLDAKKRIFLNQDKDDFLILNERDPLLKGLAKETRAKCLYFSESAEFNPNQAAAVTVSGIFNIDKNSCLKVFKEFKGLEHRLEYVTQINNIRFINDSKATLAESTAWAIKNIPSPVILIAGGKDKGVDYASILSIAARRVKGVILIGEAKEKIKKALGTALSIDEAATLEEAVHKAYHKAIPGDCVLLSPMCSSFDMFLDYQDRGNCFKKAVFALAKNNS
jgi:UDP-N-acetylmuramoylalanine--D-glutamate ligase